MHTLTAILVVGMRKWDLSLQDTVLLILAALIAAVIYWFRPDDDKEFWRDYDRTLGWRRRRRELGRRRGTNYNLNFYFITFVIVCVILKVLNSWKM